MTKLDVAPLTYVATGATEHDREHTKDLATFRAALIEDLRNDRKTVVVLDLRHSSVLTTSQRWMTAVWMTQVAPLFERTTFGTVFIVESALVRGVLSALLWVQPKGTPYAIVRDLDAAAAWAIDCMDEAKVNLSTEVRENPSGALRAELARLHRDAA